MVGQAVGISEKKRCQNHYAHKAKCSPGDSSAEEKIVGLADEFEETGGSGRWRFLPGLLRQGQWFIGGRGKVTLQNLLQVISLFEDGGTMGARVGVTGIPHLVIGINSRKQAFLKISTLRR